MERKVYFLSGSDFHHGAKEPDEMMKEFYEDEMSFMNVLSSLVLDDTFKGVLITGDYYDKRISLEDPKSKVASKIFLDIFNMCKENDKWFIVTRGTYGHDFRQLDNFQALELTYDKFKLINTVTELEVDELKILAIPEEYPADELEYYKTYIQDVPDKYYDMIIGHGMFTHNSFDANSAERNMNKMPIMDVNTLFRVTNCIIYGHIHTHSIYKDILAYNGSYSRLCHGEEEPKGFLLTEYDLDTRKPLYNFIENVNAPIYKTIKINKIFALPVEELTKKIESISTTVKSLKVKIDVDLVNSDPDKVDILREYFSNSNVIIDAQRFTLKNKETVEGILQDNSEDELESNSDLDFLLDEIAIEEKILEFAKLKHPNKIDSNLTLEFIKECISDNK